MSPFYQSDNLLSDPWHHGEWGEENFITAISYIWVSNRLGNPVTVRVSHCAMYRNVGSVSNRAGWPALVRLPKVIVGAWARHISSVSFRIDIPAIELGRAKLVV